MENDHTTELPCSNKLKAFLSHTKYIHYLEGVYLEVVVDLFQQKHPRRLELLTLLRDWVVSSHFHYPWDNEQTYLLMKTMIVSSTKNFFLLLFQVFLREKNVSED